MSIYLELNTANLKYERGFDKFFTQGNVSSIINVMMWMPLNITFLVFILVEVCKLFYFPVNGNIIIFVFNFKASLITACMNDGTTAGGGMLRKDLRLNGGMEVQVMKLVAMCKVLKLILFYLRQITGPRAKHKENTETTSLQFLKGAGWR